jgi:indole-3-glycerol phosphate synthase
VDVNQSLKIAPLIPPEFLKVSESGISTAAVIHELKQSGFRGFLIGETFMKNSRPELACAKLIREIAEFEPSGPKPAVSALF